MLLDLTLIQMSTQWFCLSNQSQLGVSLCFTKQWNSTTHFNKTLSIYLISLVQEKDERENPSLDNIIFSILFPIFPTACEDYSILQIHSGFGKHSSHVTESYAIFDFCHHRNTILRVPRSYTHCTKPSVWFTFLGYAWHFHLHVLDMHSPTEVPGI